MDIKQWLSENAHRRVTDSEVAEMLGVTRKTVNTRLNSGTLTSDDLLLICERLGINRTLALVELERLPHSDVLEYLDSDGALVATAEDGELALELARRLNPATMAPEIDELAERRRNTPAPPPSVRAISDDELAAAIEEANQLRGAAHPRTEELTEPESP
ncbi:hypothetical protein CIP107580_01835 [Corynebacterium diphtheriae]|nr:hypothetical protein CIP107533_01857 [Corynebacterium diphtheriae]CAB0661660.1 hypothetical protein CIP107580_01835 [Corynebacterium diphtheriae]